jgi:hypothetical protein
VSCPRLRLCALFSRLEPAIEVAALDVKQAADADEREFAVARGISERRDGDADFSRGRFELDESRFWGDGLSVAWFLRGLFLFGKCIHALRNTPAREKNGGIYSVKLISGPESAALTFRIAFPTVESSVVSFPAISATGTPKYLVAHEPSDIPREIEPLRRFLGFQALGLTIQFVCAALRAVRCRRREGDQARPVEPHVLVRRSGPGDRAGHEHHRERALGDHEAGPCGLTGAAKLAIRPFPHCRREPFIRVCRSAADAKSKADTDATPAAKRSTTASIAKPLIRRVSA